MRLSLPLVCTWLAPPFQLAVSHPAFLPQCQMLTAPSIPASTSGGSGRGYTWAPVDGDQGGWMPQGLVVEACPALIPGGVVEGVVLPWGHGNFQSQGRGSGLEWASLALPCPFFSFLLPLARGPLGLSEISLGKCLGLLSRAGMSH